MGFPGATVVKKFPAKQEMQVQSRGQEDPVEKKMATHSVFLLEKAHGKTSLEGYSPWGCKRVWQDIATKRPQPWKQTQTHRVKKQKSVVISNLGKLPVMSSHFIRM